MKFGLNLVHYGRTVSPSALDEWCSLAEDGGYDFVTVSDHVVVTDDVRALYPDPFYEVFVTVAWLAARFATLRFGTSVVVLPYRHPLLLARMVATLDQLTAGRLFLGVGVGWARDEFRALGVPYERRGAIADESLAILRSAEARGPSMWVGGTSRSALRRAVRYGDAWHPENASMEWLRSTGVPLLARMAAEDRVPGPALAPRISLRVTDRPVSEPGRPPGTGTLDQISDDLAAFRALGATHVLFDPYSGAAEDRSAIGLSLLSRLVRELEDREAAE